MNLNSAQKTKKQPRFKLMALVGVQNFVPKASGWLPLGMVHKSLDVKISRTPSPSPCYSRFESQGYKHVQQVLIFFNAILLAASTYFVSAQTSKPT